MFPTADVVFRLWELEQQLLQLERGCRENLRYMTRAPVEVRGHEAGRINGFNASRHCIDVLIHSIVR